MLNVRKFDSFTGHKDCIYGLVKNINDNTFFSSSGDGTVVLWDLNKPDFGEMLAKVSKSVYAMALDESSTYLWLLENFEGIHIIDTDSKKEVKSIKLASTYYFDIQFFQNFVFIACGTGFLVIVNRQTFEILGTIKVSENSIRKIRIGQGELAMACSDNTVKILSLTDFSTKMVLNGHTNSVFAIDYSENKELLISGSRDAHLKLWDAKGDYTLKNDIVAHTFAINDIVYSKGFRYFATCSMDKTVKIWDASNFKLLKVLDKSRHAGHGTSVNKLLWLSDTLLVSAGDDRVVSVWEIETR